MIATRNADDCHRSAHRKPLGGAIATPGSANRTERSRANSALGESRNRTHTHTHPGRSPSSVPCNRSQGHRIAIVEPERFRVSQDTPSCCVPVRPYYRPASGRTRASRREFVDIRSGSAARSQARSRTDVDANAEVAGVHPAIEP